MKKVGKLHLLGIPEGLWQEISINIIGPLPKSNNKDAIVIIVDQFTKMIRLKVMTIAVSSQDIAKIYRNEIWKIHGVLQKILSNQGPQFISKFIKDLSKMLETKRILSIAYYSQTDSQMERINQEVNY